MMGLFGRFTENISERIDLEKVYYDAVNEANVLMKQYAELLKPLLGSEEFAKRLVNLIIFELGQQNIELKKITIDALYQDLVNFLNPQTVFLEQSFAGAWVSNEEIINHIVYHIKKLEKMIEIEMKYPQEVRLINRKEIEALIKLLENVMKEFDKHIEIEKKRRRVYWEPVAYPKTYGDRISNKITGWLLKNHNPESAKKQLEKIENDDYKDFKNDVKKSLGEIKKFVEKNY